MRTYDRTNRIKLSGGLSAAGRTATLPRPRQRSSRLRWARCSDSSAGASGGSRRVCSSLWHGSERRSGRGSCGPRRVRHRRGIPDSLHSSSHTVAHRACTHDAPVDAPACVHTSRRFVLHWHVWQHYSRANQRVHHACLAGGGRGTCGPTSRWSLRWFGVCSRTASIGLRLSRCFGRQSGCSHSSPRPSSTPLC